MSHMLFYFDMHLHVFFSQMMMKAPRKRMKRMMRRSGMIKSAG